MVATATRVLYVAAEAVPFAKAGGLGDVAGALPQALRRLGVDVRLMIPAYPNALSQTRDVRSVARFEDKPWPGAMELVSGVSVRDETPVILVRSHYFDRPGGPYADEHGRLWPDELERFAALCHAAARFIADANDWKPHIVHANDWHTSLIPSLLSARGEVAIPTLLTIHNASYQGTATAQQLRGFGVPARQLGSASRSFLELGVRHAALLNTVSPTYAKELQTKRFGCGLERLFAARSARLAGILNGVDYSVWNPARDPLISRSYDAGDLTGKAACKAALLDEMRLDTASFAPLIGVVSRLTEQKGLDLVVRIADVLITAGARMVVLGQGEPRLERAFEDLAARYPTRIAARIGFDEALAHRITAGADIFAMPSRFEPCGLAQLHSLRYGTVPVVSAVGGLRDTVTDAGQRGIERGATTGFVSRRFGPASLAIAVGKAMAVHPLTALWQTLQRNGMSQDFSWGRAARSYRDLYDRLSAGKSQHSYEIASL